jgi:membrane associated rhomboid family serine protease
MNETQKIETEQGAGGRQPIFLLPPAVLVLAGLMVAIHLARVLVLNNLAQLELMLWFGFFPIRLLAAAEIPGGMLPLLWSPFTHGFLHAGWEHLLINVAWLAIFGTPVARRYGTQGCVVLFLIGTAAGALAFAAATLPAAHVLVGASGGVAGLTGAAVRFMFQPVIVARHPETGETIVLGRRLARLGEVFRNQRSAFFIVIWVVLNASVAVLPAFTGGEPIPIAWQAHLGGFFAGLFLVPLFERRPPQEVRNERG